MDYKATKSVRDILRQEKKRPAWELLNYNPCVQLRAGEDYIKLQGRFGIAQLKAIVRFMEKL